MNFSSVEASRVKSSLDGICWSLVNENPAQAHLLQHGVSQIPFGRLSYQEFINKVDRYSPLFSGIPGNADWVTAWRFHQLGMAGFEMIFNELQHRPGMSFRLDDPTEASNPVWSVISNRNFELQGGDPLKRHLTP